VWGNILKVSLATGLPGGFCGRLEVNGFVQALARELGTVCGEGSIVCVSGGVLGRRVEGCGVLDSCVGGDAREDEHQAREESFETHGWWWWWWLRVIWIYCN